jgi:site-specific DNA recombinase
MLTRNGCIVVTLAVIPGESETAYQGHSERVIPAARQGGLGWLQHIIGITAPIVGEHVRGPGRRTAVAEWYVLNMLELSWGGFKAHTEQGFNIGKPPYGYRAERMRHPVKAKALEGKMKHRLAPDLVQGPVVTQIFQWRALDRLSYRAIAERLNLDLDRYPPPIPIVRDTHRRLGVWTQNSVREVLDNPKHTGYMVWNRRKNARPERGVSGRVNPPSQWVWSSRPTHEPLVTRALFEAASTIGRFRKGSRPGAGANSHGQTARTYVLRSYLFCDLCGRRTFGSSRKQYTYYRCTPNRRYHENQSWFASHPANVLVREDLLLEPLAAFFKNRVFGKHREMLLADSVAAPTRELQLDTERRTLLAQIAELKRRRDNLLRELQTYQAIGDEDVDSARRNSLREQFAANVTQERFLAARLTEIVQRQQEVAGPDLTLFDALPQTAIDLTQLPEDDQRELYNAFGLEIRYNALRREVTLRVSLDGETAPLLSANINRTIQGSHQRDEPKTETPGPEALASGPGGRVCDASRAPGRPRETSQSIDEEGKRVPLLIEEVILLP